VSSYLLCEFYLNALPSVAQEHLHNCSQLESALVSPPPEPMKEHTQPLIELGRAVKHSSPFSGEIIQLGRYRCQRFGGIFQFLVLLAEADVKIFGRAMELYNGVAVFKRVDMLLKIVQRLELGISLGPNTIEGSLFNGSRLGRARCNQPRWAKCCAPLIRNRKFQPVARLQLELGHNFGR
jgi:hypothetical protein